MLWGQIAIAWNMLEKKSWLHSFPELIAVTQVARRVQIYESHTFQFFIKQRKGKHITYIYNSFDLVKVQINAWPRIYGEKALIHWGSKTSFFGIIPPHIPPQQVSWDDPLKIMVETIWEAILKRLWSLNFIGPSAGSLSAAKSSITSFSTQLTRGLSILAIFLLIKGSRQSNNISGETFQDWRSRTSSWEPPVCQED